MASVEKKVPEFKKTINTETVIRRIESGWYAGLTWLFDEYPIFAVRRTVLRKLLDRSIPVSYQEADWIETRVFDLKQEEEETRSGFWNELLGWYVFNAKSDELINRALDFAVGITKMDFFAGTHGFVHRSDVLKIVSGRLDESPRIYRDMETSTLKLFLQSFLVQTCQPNSTIYDFTMVDIKRVVRCVIKVEDWDFLPLIEQVLYKLSNQSRPKGYDFKQEVETLENIAFLREAVRLLREK